MIVHTQYAWRPSAHAARMRSISSGRRCAPSTTVCTGVRPGGSSSMADTSRSAYAAIANVCGMGVAVRSEEHTSELQSLMRISYAVFCLKKKIKQLTRQTEYAG